MTLNHEQAEKVIEALSIARDKLREDGRLQTRIIVEEAIAILTPSESVETEIVRECPSCHCVVGRELNGHHSAADCQYLKQLAAAREQGAREERNLCVLRADIWIRRNDPDIDLDEHEALCAAIMGDSGKVEKSTEPT